MHFNNNLLTEARKFNLSLNVGHVTLRCKEETLTLIVSIGYNIDVDSAEASPPAKADFRTFPVGNSTGGATATTVAASNQIFLYII